MKPATISLTKLFLNQPHDEKKTLTALKTTITSLPKYLNNNILASWLFEIISVTIYIN